MSLASVAIVGRPNVGKSSLLNALVGERISIVDPTPGVTRDRVVADVRHEGRCFHVIDTGGVGIVDRDDLEDHVEQQINAAVSGSDVVLFVVDIQEGLTKLDRDAVAFLRRSGKPVVLVANKADHERFDHAAGEFARLGLGEPLLVAAKFNIGIDELRDAMVAHLPEKSPEEDLHNSDEMRLALVGQRNAGKSTLLNAILGEERVIVSPIAGTTRDAVDVRAVFRGRTFVAIDTAGVRKANKVQDSIEFYSQVRSREAVERAQVVILLIDSTKEVSQVDKTVADWILTHRKPCVLAINKWDLAESITTDDYLKYLETRLPLLHYAPVVFLSAKDRTRVDDLLTVAFDIWAQAGMRVGTPEVNRVLRQAVEKRSPRVTAGKLPKIFYGTQVGVYPPWFVFFTSDPKVIGDDYKRYLENRFREAFGFREIPLRVSFRERKSLGRVPGGGMGRDQDDMESVIPPLVGDDDGDLI